MNIKVLGTGCANCKHLLQLVEYAVQKLEVKAEIEYITELVEISKYGLLRTPGLIINQKIVSYGRVPKLNEIEQMIEENR